MNELLVAPTADRVLVELMSAANEASQRVNGHRMVPVSNYELAAWATAAAVGPVPDGVRFWTGDGIHNRNRAVVVGWWTDHVGRRHVRVRGFAEGWRKPGGDGSPLGFVYPGVAFRVRTGSGPATDLVACVCGAVGTPAAMAWMGERCGPCHDRAEETGFRPPLVTKAGGQPAFTPDGTGLVGPLPDFAHVDLRTGRRIPMPPVRLPTGLSLLDRRPELVGCAPDGRVLIGFARLYVVVWDVGAGTVGPPVEVPLGEAALSPCGRFLCTGPIFRRIDWDTPADPVRYMRTRPWNAHGGGFSQDGTLWVGLTDDDRFVRVELPSLAESEIESAVFDDLDEPWGDSRVRLHAVAPDHDLALVCVRDDEHGLRGPMYLGSLSGRTPWRELPFEDGSDGEVPEQAVFSRCGEYLIVTSEGDGVGVYPVAGGPPTWAVAAVAVGLILAGASGYVLTRPNPAPGGGPQPVAAVTPPAAPPVDPEAERLAAVYALSVGGGVKVTGSDGIVNTVEGLPKAPFAVTWVYLRDNPRVRDDGLAAFRRSTGVRHLDFANSAVTDAGLAAFAGCREMAVLELFDTAVGDAGLAHLRECRGLTQLSLRSTKVTDAGLAPFAGCDRLEVLGLGHTAVTETGLAHFAGCRRLRHLDLDALPITDAGLAPFAGCDGLEVLHLGGTRATDAGLAPFQACPRLKLLHLNGSKVTAAGVAALSAAVPGCRIEWDGGVIDPSAPPFDPAAVAALPAAEQVEAVRKELVRRNPGFDGTLTPTVEDGAITRLELAGTKIADLGPLRALTRLTELSCKSDALADYKLADLAPLKGLPLVKLDLSVSRVTDLSPLRGMPLTDLHIDNSPVADLSPLKGLPLRVLNVSYTKVADLTPLKGAPLFILWTNHTEVADLSPLAGMQLQWITIQGTKVTDTRLLKDMPLDRVYLDSIPARDRELLRGIPALRQINDRPAAEFLKPEEGKP